MKEFKSLKDSAQTLLFITAVPNTNLCAWGEEESGEHVPLLLFITAVPIIKLFVGPMIGFTGAVLLQHSRKMKTQFAHRHELEVQLLFPEFVLWRT